MNGEHSNNRAYERGVPPVKVGLVGCGYHMSTTLGPAIRAVKELEVVAVCDLNLELAARVAERFEGARAFASAMEMLDRVDLAAVVMASTPQVHHEVGCEALRRGLHLFVEKPAAISAEATRELSEIAEREGLVAVVGHNLRHADAWKLGSELTENPDYGEVVTLHASYLANAPRGSRWGLDPVKSFLLTHAVHPLDLAVSLFGGPSQIFAHATEIQDHGVVLTAHLEFPSGKAATVTAGTAAPSLQLDMRLLSDRSHFIRVDGLRRVTSSLVDDRQRGAFRQTGRWDLRTLESSAFAAGYQPEVESFARAVLGGGEPSPTLADALPVYEAIDDVARSLMTRAVVG